MKQFKKKIRKYLCIAFFPLNFLQTALAQTSNLVNTAQSPMVFRQVTHPFMPVITSSYFFFSQDGLMWFSTYKGLTSFDGSEIIYYSNEAETADLDLSNIFSMAEDKEHNFYIETRRRLIFFNRKKRNFFSFDYIFSDLKKSINAGNGGILIDKEGTVFFGTVANGLIVFYPATKKLEHYNLDISKNDSWANNINNTVRCIAAHATDESKLWLGTFNGIYLFDKRTKSLSKNFFVTNPQYNLSGKKRTYYDIQKMDVANDSTIWFNIWSGGFCKYNTHTGRVIIYMQDTLFMKEKSLPLYIVPSFTKISPDDYLLAIYNKSPGIFNTQTKTINFFNVTNDTAAYDITTFVEKDTHENIWLWRNGLLYVTVPQALRLQTLHIKKPIKFHEHFHELRGIYYDTATSCYFGAVRFSKGIYVFDKYFTQKKIIPAPLFSNSYTNNETCTDRITKDGSGRFWSTGWETYILTPGKEKFEHAHIVFPSLQWIKNKGEFTDILTTQKGDIVLQDDDGCVYIINHVTLKTDSVKIPVIDNKYQHHIISSPVGYNAARSMIYLSNDESIAQYDLEKNKMKILPYEAVFGAIEFDQKILKFTLDDAGRIWILKENYGVRIINPETLTCIDSIPYGVRGLLPGYYTDILGGCKKYILLRSLNGIVIYDYQKQLSLLLNYANGLSHPKPYSLLCCNNYLILGQTNRIEYFNLDNFNKYHFTAQPQLNTVVADTAAVFTRTASDENVQINLHHYQNTLTFSFSATEFIFPERIEYAYRLSGTDDNWRFTNYFNRKITYTKLRPGTYIFQLKAQMQGGNWQYTPQKYTIVIQPAFYQTNWFKISGFIAVGLLAFVLIRWRINSVRKQEQQKAKTEKELLELEAKALRAQMNPHFIFNCMNSIKALIQQDDKEKAATYLTTFSKLIRTIFQNSDKREITLYDEIETCRLYTQLESMRFGDKLSYSFDVDETIDLKSIMVPALILQPFIENAIWHGIMPKEKGGTIHVGISKKEDKIFCIVEDDGIGREASMQNKMNGAAVAHQSKGVRLTQTRLELSNVLNKRNAAVEIIDKTNAGSEVAGTKVVLMFDED